MRFDTYFPAGHCAPTPVQAPPFAVLEREELLAVARAALAAGPLNADTADALGSVLWRAAAAHPDDDELQELRDCVSPPGLANVLDLAARFHRDVHAISGLLPAGVAADAHKVAQGLVDWCRLAAYEHGAVPQEYQLAATIGLADEHSRVTRIARRQLWKH